LQPIVVRPDGLLIAGERRLLAAKQLGRTSIPATVVDLDAVVRGEFAENTLRKAFTLSEAVAIKRAIEPAERAAAKQRQARAGPLNGRGAKTTGGAKLAEALVGKSRDKVAAYIGFSHTTLAKAEAIVEAAATEPERFGRLLAAMDRTGRVNGPFRRLQNTKQAELIRAEPPPLPGNGPYRVGVADVPWPYEADDENAALRGVLPYPTMSIEQICDLDVASIMHDDSILWFWIPNFHLAQGFHVPVLRAWGFLPKTILTWPKDRPGRGHWLKGQTEHVIMAVRGKPIVTLTDQTTLLSGPFHLLRKNAHSEKPLEFYDFVERLCPAPRYCDLFSRYRHNNKWDCHGDQAPDYDAADDITKSVDEGFRAIRARRANGGKGWGPVADQQMGSDNKNGAAPSKGNSTDDLPITTNINGAGRRPTTEDGSDAVSPPTS
jgi:N6-adenosine-specific RNA methylase IME4